MVVPSLRDDLILTADAVDRLFAADAKLSCVSTRSMAHRSVRCAVPTNYHLMPNVYDDY